ncbi:MAG: response regulator [Rhodocyclaceae bacterium]|nr:response regulator [Rhodocyclaceae bacterium]
MTQPHAIHILMVEDDPGDVFLIREALKSSALRFMLHHADNGEKALDFLHRRPPFEAAERPHLILLDLNLPRVNGIEVLRDIKSVPELSGIPVIVLSTSKSETDAHLCRQMGADDFISKAPSFEEFLAVGKVIEDFWLERQNPVGEREWTA